MLTVVYPGPFATIQDLGRPGYGAWGISPGGAADIGSFKLANRLVGNDERAAAIELTFGSARLRFDMPAIIAVSGAALPVKVGSRAGVCDGPQVVPAGTEVTFGTPHQGLRTYIAVRGGIDTELILGSRSTDPASGFGNRLEPGDTLPIGNALLGVPTVDVAPRQSSQQPVLLDAVPGPRYDWFESDIFTSLQSAQYIVGIDSNRVGVRLAGPPLHRSRSDELPSEPAIRGAIEVPSDGQPIIFMADHPTTCGYPIVAVLEPASSDRCAQLRPGDSVRIRMRRNNQSL